MYGVQHKYLNQFQFTTAVCVRVRVEKILGTSLIKNCLANYI